jgi:CubicO group peptidase (beta-lactamase class C family)
MSWKTIPMNVSVLVALFSLVSVAIESRADDLASRISNYMAHASQKQNFSGAILVAHQGRVLMKAYGFANAEWSVPNTPQTKFEIGSLTKQFTAAAILKLVQDGKLRFEAPVSEYLSNVPAAWSPITIHQLLTHTSGIPNTSNLSDYAQGLDHTYSPEELIRLVKNRPLEYEPGTKWKYSNTDYYLLGYLIEQVSGESYEQYLEHHLFGPVAMRDSGYNSYTRIITRRACVYSREGGQLQNASRADPSIPYAAGAVFSTVEDLLKWDEALWTEVRARHERGKRRAFLRRVAAITALLVLLGILVLESGYGPIQTNTSEMHRNRWLCPGGPWCSSRSGARRRIFSSMSLRPVLRRRPARRNDGTQT